MQILAVFVWSGESNLPVYFYHDRHISVSLRDSRGTRRSGHGRARDRQRVRESLSASCPQLVRVDEAAPIGRPDRSHRPVRSAGQCFFIPPHPVPRSERVRKAPRRRSVHSRQLVKVGVVAVCANHPLVSSFLCERWGRTGRWSPHPFGGERKSCTISWGRARSNADCDESCGATLEPAPRA